MFLDIGSEVRQHLVGLNADLTVAVVDDEMHFDQHVRAAGRDEGLVKFQLSLAPKPGKFIDHAKGAHPAFDMRQLVVGGGQARFPSDATVDDRRASTFTFQHDPHAGDIILLFQGPSRHPESALFLKFNQPYRRKTQQTFPNGAGCAAVILSENLGSQFHAMRELSAD